MKKTRLDVPLGGIFLAGDGREFECANLVSAKLDTCCFGCAFSKRNYKRLCHSVECNAGSRADGNYVIFKEVK